MDEFAEKLAEIDAVAEQRRIAANLGPRGTIRWF